MSDTPKSLIAKLREQHYAREEKKRMEEDEGHIHERVRENDRDIEMER